MDISKFIDRLSEEQQKNALMVAEEAIRQGVNPNLAVAIAYQESKLLTNVRRGNDGEYGIMQVLPSTGKEMGFDENALQDPAKNIAAGIQYLKRGLQETGGDTKLTAAFYNGGPGAIVALREGKSPDPRVLNYVRSLSGLGVFAEPEQQAEPTSPEADSGELIPVPNPPVPEPQTDTSGASPGERMLGAGLGTVAGAVSTGAQGLSQSRTNAAVKRAELEEAARERARIAAQRAAAAPGGAPGAPAAPQGAPGQSTMRQQPVQTPMERFMGRGSGTANYGRAFGLTDIEATQATSMSNQPGGAGDLIKRRAEGLARVGQVAPGAQFVENPMYGGLMTPQDSRPPRQSFTQQPGGLAPRDVPPAKPISTAPPAPSGLERATNYFKQMMRPVATAASTVGKYALPPVAGAMAGLDLAEMAHEYDKPEDQRDYTKMGLRGASALGGALSMIPATAPIGVPLSLGATGIQAYRDDPEILNKIRRRIFSSDVAEPSPSP